ncbi:MAG: CPXCG motif-containing cysteine-rich protein [Phycisphaeraceae bacterium]
MDDLADYTCPTCGESIQLGIDPTAGREQHYIEDCPVCCNPNAIAVYFDRDGNADVEARVSQ